MRMNPMLSRAASSVRPRCQPRRATATSARRTRQRRSPHEAPGSRGTAGEGRGVGSSMSGLQGQRRMVRWLAGGVKAGVRRGILEWWRRIRGGAMLEINERIRIPDEELEWSYARSGGPGGQNVNKVNSKAILRWRLATSTSLPDEVKLRPQGQERRRITTEGDLVVSSQRFSDQERNREDCLEKLRAMVLRACTAPRPRKPTRPTRGSKQRRLAEKRHRSAARERRRVEEE